jgi:hypothetical protein
MKDSDSFWCSWKLYSTIFMMALLWESVIASVYWSILWPDDKKAHHGVWFFWNAGDHAAPIILLTIDFIFNRVYWELNQIYANMLIFLIYGFVNLGVTYGTGTPVYPPISWDSVGSWCLGLAMIPLCALYYLMWYSLTKLKFRWMKMHDSITYM